MKKAPKPLLLPVSQIIADPANQPRSKLDGGLIKRIEQTIRDGRALQPLVVTAEGDPLGEVHYTLYDGFHRHAAAVRVHAEQIVPVEIATDAHAAFLRTVELNAHGTSWSKKDAMRHALVGFRDGTYWNHDAPWPVSLLAHHYGAYGVRRNALTRFLMAHAYGVPPNPSGRTRGAREGIKADPKLAAVLEASRQRWDKRNRPDEAPSALELARRRAKKNAKTAKSYLTMAARLLHGVPDEMRNEAVRGFHARLSAG